MNRFAPFAGNARTVSQQIAPRTVPVYAPNRIEARERVAARAARSRQTAFPRWMMFAVIAVLTFAFCVALNFKSQAKMNVEQSQQSDLQSELEGLKNGNAALSEEINRLHNDPATIERTARQQLSMVRADEKILIPAR